MRKHFEMIIVIIVTFMTLVAMFTLKSSYTPISVITFDDDSQSVDDDAKYIFDDYYNVNIKLK